ncbi:sigma-70 family RNA polymerase sigma factor [Lacticaseibacillus saniviri]
MLDRYVEGFNLYLRNKGVVYGALARLAIPRNSPSYEDEVHDGIEIYVDYYVKYRDPVVTEAEQRKFNKLAGTFVYKTLLKHRMMQYRRSQIAPVVSEEASAKLTAHEYLASDIVQTNSLVTLLYAQLTPVERQVLILRYYDQLSNVEIMAQLGLSKQRVSAIRKQIAKKYLQVAQQ